MIEKSNYNFYSKERLHESLDNFERTWFHVLNSEEKIYDPISNKIVQDPKHFITKLMLNMYSMESYLYGTLNYALRVGDLSKIDSHGPYA